MSLPAVWSVLSDLTKLLDLRRNKHIGIKQLLKNDNISSEEGANERTNKVPFNHTIIEQVQICLAFLTTNLSPKEDLKLFIAQYLTECESISKYRLYKQYSACF